MNIIACNDPRLSGKPSLWEEMVEQLEGSETDRIILFSGFVNGHLVAEPQDAARRVWEMISEQGAEALLLDVRGYPGTQDSENFWINVYRALLNIREFGIYKTQSRLRVKFISRYLGPHIRAQLADLEVAGGDIVDYYGWDVTQFLRDLREQIG